jgi:hypothetical protein
MSAIDKDLGMATAYAYAVSKGYTGTEEEFAQYIANVGQTAQAAAESAESAARSATTAGQSAESAAQSALEVSGAVTDAEAAATSAGESEAAAVESAADAETEALKSEGHAVGKQDGVDVDAQSEYYQNNSKYYSDRAKDIYDDAVEVRDSIPADYSQLSQDVDDLKADLSDKLDAYLNVEFSIDNKRVNQVGSIIGSTGQHITDYYPCSEGTMVKWHGMSFIHNGASVMCLIAFFDANKTFITGITSVSGETASVVGDVSTVAPAGTAYVVGSTNISVVEPYLHVYDVNITKIQSEIHEAYMNLPLSKQIIQSPALTNGSSGNIGNKNAVTARAVPFYDAVSIVVKNNRAVSAAGNYYKYDVSAFKGKSWYTNRITGILADDNEEFIFDCSTVINKVAGVTGFGVTIWEYDSSDVLQTLRIGSFDNCDLIVRYVYPENVQAFREINNDEVKHKLLNARHQKGNAGTPLTLLHFSDLHADTAALKRIVDDANYYYGTNINDKICTGDIVASMYAEIASWWDASVLTCIGNHDTASYSGGTYDWTALSMADRDAYYIAPFESNWGIVHTAGTSYYYKDYTTQKVRLIVMDGMLYNDNGAEATAQTSWLENLLADAIANNLHVLIATHAPHGGATAKECSFSKYGQGAMPTNLDCNTPQSVIDIVASAISGGLNFIGYIVGHTHQDNIWDVENTGKQLMYCVTCANTASNAQWKGSDQDRSSNIDAYNLITIDTANTLVKIVRGGGADIDDHMRTRKAICFDYSTGEKVGEVL